MNDKSNSSIFSLYESLNQSAIAHDQQRHKQSFIPGEGPGFAKGTIPTTTSAKVGIPSSGLGISDEEGPMVMVKGVGSMRRDQVEKMLDTVKKRIVSYISKNVTGHTIKGEIDLYETLIQSLKLDN